MVARTLAILLAGTLTAASAPAQNRVVPDLPPVHVTVSVGHSRTLPLKFSPRSYSTHGGGLRIIVGKDNKGNPTLTLQGTAPGRVVVDMFCDGGHSQVIVADVS